MAQRTGPTPWLSLSGMAAPLYGSAFPGEPEEGEPVPACPRDFARDSAQGAIAPSQMLEALHQDFRRDGLATEVTAQERAGRWNAPIVSRPQSAPSDAGSHWGIDLPHPGWRPATQIGLVCDFAGALEGPFRQSPFGEGLQAPSHAAEQLILVFRARLFAKQLA